MPLYNFIIESSSERIELEAVFSSDLIASDVAEAHQREWAENDPFVTFFVKGPDGQMVTIVGTGEMQSPLTDSVMAA